MQSSLLFEEHFQMLGCAVFHQIKRNLTLFEVTFLKIEIKF